VGGTPSYMSPEMFKESLQRRCSWRHAGQPPPAGPRRLQPAAACITSQLNLSQLHHLNLRFKRQLRACAQAFSIFDLDA